MQCIHLHKIWTNKKKGEKPPTYLSKTEYIRYLYLLSKVNAFGSIGVPSGAIPFWPNFLSIYNSLALSKSTLSFSIICLISFLETSSKPPLTSLLFSEIISKLLEWRPFSRSSAKESFKRICLLKPDCILERSARNLSAITAVSI